MCGRFELHTNPAAIALAFGLSQPPAIAPRYNIAPTQDVPVVRETRDGDRELAQVRWGLVPRWAKDPSIGVRMINARAETLADKPAFRNALKWHRCLLPADGFYEWKAVAGGKQPYRIGMKDGAVFALAGLTERWLSRDGEVLDTCAIVTTPAKGARTTVWSSWLVPNRYVSMNSSACGSRSRSRNGDGSIALNSCLSSPTCTSISTQGTGIGSPEEGASLAKADASKAGE